MALSEHSCKNLSIYLFIYLFKIETLHLYDEHNTFERNQAINCYTITNFITFYYQLNGMLTV